MQPVPLDPLSCGIPREFMRRQAPELARDIVAQLAPASKLAEMYGLTTDQWEALKNWPSFRELVATTQMELGGSLGVYERIKRKAALALDTVGVLDVVALAGDAKVTPKDRLAAIDTLKELAGAGKASVSAAGAVVGGGPLIQIVMPGGQGAIAIGGPGSGIPPLPNPDADA